MQITSSDHCLQTKVCIKCNLEKHLSKFSKSKVSAGGHRNNCITCQVEWNREYRKRTGYKSPPGKHKPGTQAASFRRWRIDKKYGITPSTYDEMLAAQNGVCALCERPAKKYRLAIDHCHETGRIRGLLCSNCNGALGTLGDNAAGLWKALNYITRALPTVT